jgi:hypothetical protein
VELNFVLLTTVSGSVLDLPFPNSLLLACALECLKF